MFLPGMANKSHLRGALSYRGHHASTRQFASANRAHAFSVISVIKEEPFPVRDCIVLRRALFCGLRRAVKREWCLRMMVPS